MERTQQEEMELAAKEKRRAICMKCENPMDTIREIQGEEIIWEWDEQKKEYVKQESDCWSDKPYCDTCGMKNWELTNNSSVNY